jgi:hypothetical protein
MVSDASCGCRVFHWITLGVGKVAKSQCRLWLAADHEAVPSRRPVSKRLWIWSWTMRSGKKCCFTNMNSSLHLNPPRRTLTIEALALYYLLPSVPYLPYIDPELLILQKDVHHSSLLIYPASCIRKSFRSPSLLLLTHDLDIPQEGVPGQ